MKSNTMVALVACAFMLLGGIPGRAQSGNEQSAGKTDKQQAEAPAPAVNAEEEAAFKAFNDAPLTATDIQKKVQLGEDFIKKYPQSRYNQVIYPMLTSMYMNLGQIDKMIDSGTHAVELNPNDVQSMAILAQSMPRSLSKDPAERIKQIVKAQEYATKAIEITPTMPKPAALSDEAFAGAKKVVLAMAHSGLGHIDLLKGKNDEAAKELEAAIQLDSQPDPVNYYLLGIANQQGSHFDDAVAAFNKCASIPGQLQPACKNNAEAAKKLASTQLSAPK